MPVDLRVKRQPLNTLYRPVNIIFTAGDSDGKFFFFFPCCKLYSENFTSHPFVAYPRDPGTRARFFKRIFFFFVLSLLSFSIRHKGGPRCAGKTDLLPDGRFSFPFRHDLCVQGGQKKKSPSPIRLLVSYLLLWMNFFIVFFPTKTGGGRFVTDVARRRIRNYRKKKNIIHHNGHGENFRAGLSSFLKKDFVFFFFF